MNRGNRQSISKFFNRTLQFFVYFSNLAKCNKGRSGLSSRKESKIIHFLTTLSFWLFLS